MSDIEDIRLKILNRKEDRWQKQLDLLKRYKKTLIVFKFNIPDWPKSTLKITRAAEIAIQQFKEYLLINGLRIIRLESVFDDLGPEYFILVNDTSKKAKGLAVKFEEQHQIGRLLDIDIMDKSGDVLNRDIKRRCFICSKSAIDCMRQQNHKTNILRDYFDAIIDDYLSV